MMKFIRKFNDLEIQGKKAHEYDEFSRQYRLKDIKEYAHLATDHVSNGGSVLEIATGPGYFCIELAKLGDFIITGLDISNDLIQIARSNAQQAGVKVDFLQGNASNLQFPDTSFDFIFCSWAIKNFREPQKVLNEMYRVLKPGGTALIIDLNHDAASQEWNKYSSSLGLKGMTALFMKLAFRIQRSGAYSKSKFVELIRSTPFQKVEIQEEGINLYVYLSR
jgi:ubiquinone/menaquinone biosynthesis C-methylase UbiE